MWKPTLQQLETVAEMAHGGMSSSRIATVLGIQHAVFTCWAARLTAANALSPEDADRLLYPPKPRAVKAPPPPHDPGTVHSP